MLDAKTAYRLDRLFRVVIFHHFRQSVFVYSESKWREVLVPYLQGSYLTDIGIFAVFAYDKYGLCLVVQFRTDMTTHIVIPFIQMQYTMDVNIIDGGPLHQRVYQTDRFRSVIYVQHHVSYAINDNQTVAIVLA